MWFMNYIVLSKLIVEKTLLFPEIGTYHNDYTYF